jgi:hypothetical protein
VSNARRRNDHGHAHTPRVLCRRQLASDDQSQTGEAKRVRARFRAKLFSSSTDREAKELFFLERFTFFQQGRYRETATLTTQRHFAVELLQKSKQHFA